MTFQFFIDRIIIWIMKRINSKWIIVVAIAKRILKNEKKTFVKSCKCEWIIRFDFFCKHVHHFFRTTIKNFFISITLLHFRWRLNDFEKKLKNWQFHYYTSNFFDDFINHDKNRNRFVNNTIEQQILYERFSKKNSSYFDQSNDWFYKKRY